MPYVKIELLKGRSKEQKAALAKSFTEALVTIAGAKANQCSIVFQDVDAGDWANDGRLSSDRTAAPEGGGKSD